MDRRVYYSVAALAYGAGLIVGIGPDPWMWRFWIPLWLALSAIALAFARRSDHKLRVMQPWAAGVLFTISAILAAVLESRVLDNIGAVFLWLGGGLVISVGLFLASYDRSLRPAAEAE